MSDTTSFHHIVICTKYRAMTIPESNCVEMYRIMAAQVKKCGGYPIATNGIGNHVHMLVDFGPDTSRASLLQAIKQNSSIWARKSGKFPLWEGWAKEYYCYSVSSDRRDAVIHYIMNQKIHHSATELTEELKNIVTSAGHVWREDEN